MNTPCILVVEDELSIQRGLQDQLQRDGYRVEVAGTVAEALAALQHRPDLVVLDRRLPDGDGLEVLRDLRARGDRTAVLVLSARGTTDDRVHGLEHGADDYLGKPFHLRELLARIRAVLQRRSEAHSPAATIAFGDVTLDVGARLLRRGSEIVELARMEFELLLYLARQPGRTVSRNELLDRVWGHDRFPSTRTIDYHVLALRKKVEADPASPRHLITVHRVGYRFDP
ncbi:MAG: response regulator transcription factor [Phycisphaerales bacterium]|jgi:two-component system alkaline phosphatase synthesis response regulator PhoP|nr:response regulator transcription factor [Phycisphaerales bacterium]